MKPLLRALALGVGPLAVAAGVGVLAQGQPPPQLAQASSLPAAACHQPPVFKPGYQLREDYVVPEGRGFHFRSESWIQADLCSAGVLAVRAQGQLAGDELPRLTIYFEDESLSTSLLDTLAFNKERIARIKIPMAGRIYLAYLNDYYLSDARIVNLQQMEFKGYDCKGFKEIRVPNESGTVKPIVATSATLTRNIPATLVPCGTGKLLLYVKGRMGKGEFPKITFKQDGKVLREMRLSERRQYITLNIPPKPLEIVLDNPYFAALANRDLYIRSLEFIPRHP